MYVREQYFTGIRLFTIIVKVNKSVEQTRRFYIILENMFEEY